MRKQTKLWKTKDGRKIRICDMSDSHLNNTIAMLERAAEAKTLSIIASAYRALSFVNGEMARFHIDDEIEHLEDHGLDVAEVFPIYENLVADRERRKR